MLVFYAVTAGLLAGAILALFGLTWWRERVGRATTPFTGTALWREFDNVQTVAGALRHVTGVDPEVGR